MKFTSAVLSTLSLLGLFSSFRSADAGTTHLPAPTKIGERFVVDDFDHKVTPNQGGTDYFGGNMGTIAFPRKLAKPAFEKVKGEFPQAPGGGGELKLSWDFTVAADRAPFAGWFMSLFGLTDTKVRLKGSAIEPASTTPFRKYFIDFDNPFGDFLPLNNRSVDAITFDLRLPAGQAATRFKFELKDESGKSAVRRARLDPGESQSFRLGRSDFTLETGFNWRRANTFAVVVELTPPGNLPANPLAGAFFLDNVALEDSDGEYPDIDAMADANGGLRPEYEYAFLDLVRARSFQYFLDFGSTSKATGGIIQDRSSFADLMTVGGIGFQIPAYIVGIERGYLTRDKAVSRVRAILRKLARLPQGSAPRGTTGHKGFFYHFIGIDGLRKLNFDFTATPELEHLNTVELSTIDTTLAVCGALVAERYFTGDDPLEADIREAAQLIYGRVDWSFMLSAPAGGLQQLYLGWKPLENRLNDDDHGRFELPDAFGTGSYSSRKDSVGGDIPLTLDFYTDEGILAAILAMGSPTPGFGVTRAVWDDLTREGTPFVKSFPGALFTYQFGDIFLDTATLGTDNHAERPIDLWQNSRTAIQATRDYAIANPAGHATLDENAWGLSAAEGPFGKYAAYAANTAALALGSSASIEGEVGPNPGSLKQRGAASGQLTRLVSAGDELAYPFTLMEAQTLSRTEVVYSNDGGGETVEVLIDGSTFGQFTAIHTRPAGGNPGDGWNVFATAPLGGQLALAPGAHTLTLRISGGDVYGIEIDITRRYPLPLLEDGTVCPYAMASSLPFLPTESIAALWSAARTRLFGTGHTPLFHPRLGFADAFNADIADATPGSGQTTLRTTGPWMQINGFAIDQGPMCLLIDRFLDGPLIAQLFRGHPRIAPVLDQLFPSRVQP